MVDTNLAQPCAVSFWTFAAPVLVGNMATLGVGLIVDTYYHGSDPSTKHTAATFAKIGAFWMTAGLVWIALNRRNGEAT